jgi:hypothetical protein
MKPFPPRKNFRLFRFVKYEYRYDAEGARLLVYLRYALESDGKESDRQRENFSEILSFPLEEGRWAETDRPALERALRALHIMAGISYYKAFLPREMAGLEMDADEAAFWTKIYQRGLGEFFYRNQIDFRGLINFPVSAANSGQVTDPAKGARAARAAEQANPLPERCLVPIGGGKDSLVTVELLKEAGMEFTLFSLRDAVPIAATAQISGKPRIVVDRALDPRLFELNEAGALNGHVPITALIAFVSAVCGILYGYRYLVFSLERSANYGQLLYHGMDVNHQYSKSAEFETDFRDFLRQRIDGRLEFFSLLRPLNELAIARIFAKLPSFERYAPHFTSCNANFRIRREKNEAPWCGHCPKCAFVFLILAPFVPRQKLIAIFNDNLAERADLLPLFEELLGLKNFKPFECVGTPEESRAALELISGNPEYANDLLVREWRDKWREKWSERERKDFVAAALQTGEHGFLPEIFWQMIKKHA